MLAAGGLVRYRRPAERELAHPPHDRLRIPGTVGDPRRSAASTGCGGTSPRSTSTARFIPKIRALSAADGVKVTDVVGDPLGPGRVGHRGEHRTHEQPGALSLDDRERDLAEVARRTPVRVSIASSSSRSSEPAGRELRRPAGHHTRRIDQVGKQQPAVDQVGRAVGNGTSRDVVRRNETPPAPAAAARSRNGPDRSSPTVRAGTGHRVQRAGW